MFICPYYTFFVILMMACYSYETEIKLVVGQLEVELMSAFKILCGRCCVRGKLGL